MTSPRGEESLGLWGAQIWPVHRPTRTYRPGRACLAEGCRTRLSIYNGSEYCWPHQPFRFPLPRGKRVVRQAA